MAVRVDIRKHPFNSHEASILISALDEELSSKYPEWPDLPHPGENIGLKKDTTPNANAKPDIASGNDGNNSNKVSILAEAEPGFGRDKSAYQDGEEGGGVSERKITFFMAWIDTEPVGCIGIKLEHYFPFHHPPEAFEDALQATVRKEISSHADIKTAQVKRLYVVRSCRSGDERFKPSIATRLVQYVEQYARTELGVKRLVVETGTKQIGAIKLYDRNGWTRRDNFGDYVSSSVERGGVSICFEKLL